MPLFFKDFDLLWNNEEADAGQADNDGSATLISETEATM